MRRNALEHDSKTEGELMETFYIARSVLAAELQLLTDLATAADPLVILI